MAASAELRRGATSSSSARVVVSSLFCLFLVAEAIAKGREVEREGVVERRVSSRARRVFEVGFLIVEAVFDVEAVDFGASRGSRGDGAVRRSG